MGCSHSSIRGDNYGTTCNICGEVLEGYGEWGEDGKGNAQHECKHSFVSEAPDSENEICVYCEITRKKGSGDE